MNTELFQFSTATVLLLLFAFYGGTYLLSRRIKHGANDADGFMIWQSPRSWTDRVAEVGICGDVVEFRFNV